MRRFALARVLEERDVPGGDPGHTPQREHGSRSRQGRRTFTWVGSRTRLPSPRGSLDRTILRRVDELQRNHPGLRRSQDSFGQRRSRALLVLPLSGLLLVAGCSGEGSGTPTPSDASPTTAPGPTPTLTPTPTPVAVEGARAWEITLSEDLLQGPSTLNRRGDFMLANEHLRAVIQKPGRVIGWGLFGGTLIDVALVDETGAIGQDHFGELSLFFNLQHSLYATSVRVADDGKHSGTAVVEAEGVADLFDIIDLRAAADEYGIPIPYDVDADLPLRIKTTYRLGAGDTHLTLKTEFFNDGGEDLYFPVGDIMDSGGDLEPYVPNPEKDSYSVTLGDETLEYTWGGFGEAEFALLDFLGYFGDGVSYGYVPRQTEAGEINGMSVTISGVTVTVAESTNLLAVLTANKRSLFLVPAGGSAAFERDFFVGRDIADLTDAIYSSRGVSTGLLSGQVVDADTGAPLPHTRLGIVKDADLDAAVTACYTDAEGRFSASLPPGTYGLVAMHGFDYTQDSRPALLEPRAFTIVASQTTSERIALDAPGAIALTVQDGGDVSGGLLPARVTLYGPYTTPPKALIDTSGDSLGSNVARLVWLPGNGRFDVKPGTYDIVVTRGFEYDAAYLNGVTVGAGETVPLSVTLTRVLDTVGYISADLHVHALGSPDSPVPNHDRVRTFAAENVEVLVATDHDVVTDFGPIIEELGFDAFLTSVAGVESTTFGMGHFNVFPLTVDSDHLAGGAIDHADGDYLPLDPETGETVDVGYSPGFSSSRDNLSPSQLFEAYRRANEGEQVVQINHARGTLGGHFTVIGLDLSRLGTAEETATEPTSFRLPEGTDLFVPASFSAMELLNGTSLSGLTTLMNDWFGLMNLGYPVAGTGVSDTHSRIHSTAGYARTFVYLGEDDVVTLRADPGFSGRFAQAINSMRISLGLGLFVTSQVEGDGGVLGRMGELVTLPGGRGSLKVRVQAPSWSDFHTVEVFANATVYANVGGLSFSSPSELGPRWTFQSGTDFDVSEVEVSTTGSARAYRKETTITIPLELTEDTWIVAGARGVSGELRPGHNSGATPVGVANPIFVDADGDGLFTAPGGGSVLPEPPEEAGTSLGRVR